MKIADLKDGQVVRARVGRAGRESVEWQEWKDYFLYVQRNKKGEIVIITLHRSGWAEYSPDDYEPPTGYHPYGVFLAEDYYMEIEGLEQ